MKNYLKIGTASMLLLLSSIASAAPVQTEIPVICDDSKNIATFLVDKYKELPYVSGITQSGFLMSLWINAETKSWTILLTNQDKSCVVNAGADFSITLGKDKSM